MFQALWYEICLCTWQDFAEILFFSLAAYYLLRWLRSDQHAHLVFNFYGYCALLFGTQYAGLYTISYTLLYSAPILGIFYFLVHQTTLQKNFISYTKIRPHAMQKTSYWLDEFIGAALHSLNRNEFFLCVLERSDNLEHLLATPYLINGRISKEFLIFLLEHTTNNGMLWLTSTGILVAIDARWKHAPIDEDFLTDSAKNIPVWKQDALLMTAKTDAVILHVSGLTRLFTLITEGKSIENLTATHVHSLLKVYIPIASNTRKEKETHEYQYTKNATQQQQP